MAGSTQAPLDPIPTPATVKHAMYEDESRHFAP
jgi:hypothetical protein